MEKSENKMFSTCKCLSVKRTFKDAVSSAVVGAVSTNTVISVNFGCTLTNQDPIVNETEA